MQASEYLREQRPFLLTGSCQCSQMCMRTRLGCTYALTSPRCISNMTSHSARILRDRNSDEHRASRTSGHCGQHSPTDTLLYHFRNGYDPRGYIRVSILVKCINVVRISSNVVCHIVTLQRQIENRYRHIQTVS